MTKLFFWGITKISLSPKFLIGALIIISIVGFLISLLFPGIKLPLGIETAINATVFFGAGYLWHAHAGDMSEKLQQQALPSIVVFTIVIIALASINFEIYGYQIDMRLNRYSNYFLFYGAAISGILATLALSMRIGSNTVLEDLGKQSLQLFIWHIIIFTYLTQFTRMFISSEAFSSLRNIFIAPLFTVSSIFLILGTGRLFIIGKRYLKFLSRNA